MPSTDLPLSKELGKSSRTNCLHSENIEAGREGNTLIESGLLEGRETTLSINGLSSELERRNSSGVG